MDGRTFVTLTIRYREEGVDQMDIFSFHDVAPTFGMTEYILRTYESVYVLGVETIHIDPPEPIPQPTHGHQSRFMN